MASATFARVTFARLLASLHLRIRSLRHADARSDLGLREVEMLAPGSHWRDAAFIRQVHHFIRNGALREAAFHATELLIRQHHKSRLPISADDDLKLSTCVHCVS
jgi:hypothetical protein